MSIVHYIPELPKEGSVVYADNGKYASDRAVFKDGKFYGGGEFPSKRYIMTNVTKWFYLNEYMEYHKGQCSVSICFDIAYTILF